jgi:hypothetical protein
MTPPDPAPPSPPANPPPPISQLPRDNTRSPASSRWDGIGSAVQFVAALAITIAVLAYLILVPATPKEGPVDEGARKILDTVKQVGPGMIRIDPESPLARKVQVAQLQTSQTRAPLLMVTGTVVASLRPGVVNGVVPTSGFLAAIGGVMAGRSGDYWQFNSPEILTAFTDWQKSLADINFNRGQVTSIHELASAKLEAQQMVVNRLIKTVQAGTDAEATLASERANLLQVEIQGRKDIHEAQNALLLAIRTEAALARQLQQAGLDPALLRSVNSDVDIVMGDVPETFLERVKVGASCEARFFGVPETVFTGKVTSIAPVITKERRSLRVLFNINDLEDQLRPGMFAEIGLGTDAREVLLAPADGIIHVGRTDYILVAAGPNLWRVTPVKVGASREGQFEIVNWVKPGDPFHEPGSVAIKPTDRVMGEGAILLKPAIVKAVDVEMGATP